MSTLNDLEYEMLLSTLSYYNNPVVPRNVVQAVVENNSRLNDKFQAYFEQSMTQLPSVFTDSVKKSVKNIFESAKEIFDKFDTEKKRFAYYTYKGLMIKPVEYQIGFEFKGKNNEKRVEIKGIYIPLRWSLKTLLEIPGVMETLLNYMKQLQSDELFCNFIQGDLWKQITLSRSSEEIWLPIFVFVDEAEMGNALGPQAGKNKFCGVYTNIACFPPEIASRLDFILLTALFRAKDRKKFGNQAVFMKLIKELNKLRDEGMNVNNNGKNYFVRFQLSLIRGDNLGLNEVLGFIDSFTHGRPCRICRATIDQIRKLVTEIEELIRTTENYKIDLELLNETLTGIKERCIFNLVRGFHVCLNLILDIMHDIFEGVCIYVMCLIISNLIKAGFFNLDELNEDTANFQYGPMESSNKIPEIKEEHLRANKLKMSAIQILTFTRYFGIIIGEKVDDIDGNKNWSLYILLRKLIDYVTSPRMHEGFMQQIEWIVPELLTLFVELGGHLTVKMHNLTHLLRVIKLNGPPEQYSAMRCEAKHRILKLTGVTTCNRVNMMKTIGLRSQLRLAYFRLTQSIDFERVIFDKSDIINDHDKMIFFKNCSENEVIYEVESVIFNEIEYSVNMVHVIEMGETNEDLRFGLIMTIFIKNDEVYLCMKVLRYLYWHDHFHAYRVIDQNPMSRVVKNVTKIPDIHPCLMVTKKIRNETQIFVATRYAL